MKRFVLLVLLFSLCIGISGSDIPVVELTPEERAYLDSLGSITMCVDPDWMPYELVDEDGQFIGIAADLVELVSQRLDIPFTLIHTEHWDETLERSRAGECMVIPFLNQTPAREEWLIFTEPIFTDPNVFITREEHPFIIDPRDIYDEVMVLPSGTSMEEFIRNDYPNITVITTPTEIEAFRMVERREADMTLRSMIIAAYTIRKEGFFNLKIAGQFPGYVNNLRMGVQKDMPKLVEILNKAIVTITPREREEIINRHVYIVVEDPADYTMAIRIVTILVVISLLAMLWSYRLKKLNEERNILLENIMTQVWYMTSPDTYGAVNKAHAQFHGKKVSDIAFKKVSDVLPPDAAEAVLRTASEVFVTGKTIRSEQWTAGISGEEKLLSLAAAPKLQSNKTVEYIVCSAEDITLHYQAEQQQRIVDKSESLARMAGAVAHNYNNLMAAVIGNIELAADDPALPEGTSRLLSEAMKAARRTSELGSFMLSYLGETSMVINSLDISDICRDEARNFTKMGSKVSISTETPDGPVCIFADEKNVRQVLRGVLHNAVESVSEDAGAVTMRVYRIPGFQIPESGRFPVTFTPKPGEYAAVAVQDNGGGMDGDTMHSIFDPFFSTKFLGRGLDLSVVLGILQAHRGCITVESTVSWGSIFTIYLPLNIQDAQ